MTTFLDSKDLEKKEYASHTYIVYNNYRLKQTCEKKKATEMINQKSSFYHKELYTGQRVLLFFLFKFIPFFLAFVFRAVVLYVKCESSFKSIH